MKSQPLAWAPKIYLFIAYTYIFAPLATLLLFSFQSGRVQSFPIEGLTLHWYAAALTNPAFQSGLQTSLIVAAFVAPLSTALGFASAHWLCRGRPKFPLVDSAFVSMPAFVPLILSGLTILMYFQWIGIDGTLGAIVVAQSCYCSPFAFIVLYLSYQRLNPDLEQAAINLGATPREVLLTIVLPQLMRPLIAALLLTALVSWDEFVIAFFVGGFTKTLPTVLYAALSTSFDPSLNALGVMVTASSAALLSLAAALLWRESALREVT